MKMKTIAWVLLTAIQALTNEPVLADFGIQPVVTTSKTMGTAESVALSNGHLFAGCRGSGLRILDISNTIFPADISGYDLAAGLSHFEFSLTGHLACIFADSNLVIVDIREPNHPHEIGHLYLNYAARGVIAKGNHVFVIGAHSLFSIDISDPTQPRIATWRFFQNTPLSIGLRNHLLVMTQYHGVTIFDVSNPDSLNILGQRDIEELQSSYQITFKDNFALIAAYNLGLMVLDISDPTHLEAPHFFQENANYSLVGVTVKNNRAFISNHVQSEDQNWGLLQVADISDPMNPRILSSTRVQYTAWDTAVMDTTVYLAAHYDGVIVYNLVDDSTLTRKFSTSSFVLQDVAVSGNTAFVHQLDFGITTLNVSEPASPFILD